MSLDPDAAAILARAANRSALVSEALRAYRARELEKELAAAYAQGYEESARLAVEWESADAEIEEP